MIWLKELILGADDKPSSAEKEPGRGETSKESNATTPPAKGRRGKKKNTEDDE
jgi:hypothetical protein